MGCGASTAKAPSRKYLEAEPPLILSPTRKNVADKNGGAVLADTGAATASIAPTESEATVALPGGASNMTQGHHWAEASPTKERRPAAKPWRMEEAMQEEAVVEGCVPCEPAAAAAHHNFDFKCAFPMMVMKMETFMALDKMTSFEDMIKAGLVFEWTPEMGRVFFLSHQWTSFSHPDPLSEQLGVAQQFLGKIREGKIRSLFATEEEWLAFHYKETNRFLQFDPVSEEQMAADVAAGYVWLDYSSVPQAADAEEQRLRAIDSIPYYVDNALCFLAIVPKVEHKDLPGTFCTYKSWQERGWCRLETQVHELRLFSQAEGELMPGMPKLDLPRRPLIVHSGEYATTYDMMDNFYMLWQRKTSIFTGEFACCRLGHRRKTASGELTNVTCDKTRIRPLVKSLWERKVAHLATMPPFVRWIFHWRWASHTDMLMSDFVDDTQQACDPSLRTLDDVCRKYLLDAEHKATFDALMPMFGGMFAAHPSFQEPDDTPASGGGGAGFKAQWDAWFGAWAAQTADLASYQLAQATCFVVAEGNLEMLRTLHEQHGADLTLGYCWGITLLDFAAGKGHTRIIEYLVAHGATGTIDKPSFRERITAIDRACKSGFLNVLDQLVALGASLFTVRLNRQVPAHGAAIMGHTHTLRRLHELGAAVVDACDETGRSPLDYATYFCHKDAAEYLRSLQGGRLTRHEEKRLLGAATKMQALRRGESARKEVRAIQAATKPARRPPTDEPCVRWG